MSKNETGLIVEGQTEFLALQKHTARKYIKIARRFSGESKIDTIAEEIASLSRLLSPNCNNIIALLDREERLESCSQFESEIQKCLEKHNTNGANITVICADKMFENWLLADIKSLKKKTYIKNSSKQKNYEGTHGVNELKKIFERKYSYCKTTHGVELYKTINTTTASLNSASFCLFKNNL